MRGALTPCPCAYRDIRLSRHIRYNAYSRAPYCHNIRHRFVISLRHLLRHADYVTATAACRHLLTIDISSRFISPPQRHFDAVSPRLLHYVTTIDHRRHLFSVMCAMLRRDERYGALRGDGYYAIDIRHAASALRCMMPLILMLTPDVDGALRDSARATISS